MKTVEVNVIYRYKVEIDESDEIVKEYEDENSLLLDCATYHFGTGLPVIRDGGVKVVSVDLIEIE